MRHRKFIVNGRWTSGKTYYILVTSKAIIFTRADGRWCVRFRRDQAHTLFFFKMNGTVRLEEMLRHWRTTWCVNIQEVPVNAGTCHYYQRRERSGMSNRKFMFYGYFQQGHEMTMLFTPRSIVAEGKHRGGWRCRWDRADLIDLYYPMTGTETLQQFLGFMRRVWEVRIREVPV